MRLSAVKFIFRQFAISHRVSKQFNCTLSRRCRSRANSRRIEVENVFRIFALAIPMRTHNFMSSVLPNGIDALQRPAAFQSALDSCRLFTHVFSWRIDRLDYVWEFVNIHIRRLFDCFAFRIMLKICASLCFELDTSCGISMHGGISRRITA